MQVKPKFKLGQKVIFIKSKYNDGKYDVGFVVGISVKRSYKSCGIFQNGGLNCAENERKGLLKNYIDHIDYASYEVIHQIHTLAQQECRREQQVDESEIVPYTKENLLLYPVGEYKYKESK